MSTTRYDQNDFANKIAQGGGGGLVVAQGGPQSVFQRYVVLESITDPTMVNAQKLDQWQHTIGLKNAEIGLALPRNTIIGQRVLDGTSSSADPPMFLYPFLPSHIALPCNPGEVVWVMFENVDARQTDIGYWMWKIVMPGFVDDVNHTHSPRALDPSFTSSTRANYQGSQVPVYEHRNGVVKYDANGKRYSRGSSQFIPGKETAFENLVTKTDGAALTTYEAVPRFRKRPSDTVFEGTNNTLIVLGTNRAAAAASWTPDANGVLFPQKPLSDMLSGSCGTVDIVVGRQAKKTVPTTRLDGTNLATEIEKYSGSIDPQEGDFDYETDAVHVRAAQATMVDKDLSLDQLLRSGFSVETVTDSATGDSCLVLKADKIRLIARKDFVFTVQPSVQNQSTDDCPTVVLNALTKNIVMIPGKSGVIMLGGDDATLAPLCNTGANAGGQVQAAPIVTTMGGSAGGPPGSATGSFATKVLMK